MRESCIAPQQGIESWSGVFASLSLEWGIGSCSCRSGAIGFTGRKDRRESCVLHFLPRPVTPWEGCLEAGG
jgi:hypothetical protein